MFGTLSIQIGIGSTREENNTTRRRAKMLMWVISVNRNWSIHRMAGLPTSPKCLSSLAYKWINIFQSRGKNISTNTSTHSVPTSFRKATTFLQDEHLKEIFAASDKSYFYFKVQCHYSFRKNDPPHNLKVALCIVSGKVKHTYCTCVAGAVGFCNHVIAFMMKVCKFILYSCKSVSDLENEDDMQPKQAWTSMLQQWHLKGRGDTIVPQPAMAVVVHKTYQDLDLLQEKLGRAAYYMKPGHFKVGEVKGQMSRGCVKGRKQKILKRHWHK